MMPRFIVLAVGLASSPTQVETPLPFTVGEKITYEIRVANGSKVGTATMWIDGPVAVRGISTYLLRFDSRIRFLLVPAVSRSSSWFDPVRGRSLRFSKHERNPLSHHDDAIDLYPDEKRWKSAEGNAGQSLSSAPRRAFIHVFHPYAADGAGCYLHLRSPLRCYAQSNGCKGDSA
jgi:hypothetical protein